MQKRYPFKFLDAYTRDDVAFYFGREEEVAKLYEMVFQTDLLLIYGASGTGKTSLIQCGLANKFDTHDWLSLFIRRGNNINDSLGKILTEAGNQYSEPESHLAWLDQVWALEQEKPETPSSPLAKQFKDVYLRHFRPIYLIFDQFEELYIINPDKEEQNKFFETINEILRLDQPIKIIISIREEYLGYLYDFEQKVHDLLRKKLRVEPMTLDKVKTVIEGVGKSKESNVSLEKNEEETIARQIFEKIKGKDRKISIELPYLQVFLDKLYLHNTQDETRKAETTFTLADLKKIGDIGDVLRELLDEQAAIIAKENNLTSDFIWKILSPFVTLDGTKEPLSVEDLKAHFPAMETETIKQILQSFVNRRILRFIENEELYEISHDSLAKQIHAKRSDEEIALLEVQRLIKSQVSLKEENRAFFEENQLLFMEPFLNRCPLNEKERTWIEKSKQYVEKQKKEKVKNKRIKKLLNIILVLLFVAFVAIGFAFYFMKSSISERDIAKAAKIELQAEKEEKEKLTKESDERLQFNNFEDCAETIVTTGSGGDITDIIYEMKNIAEHHSDSVSMNKRIINLEKLNKNE